MGSRNIFTLARSAPGVSELASGQTNFASGTTEANFSSNGARLRSNNIMIDGQDSNDPSVTGRQQPINNTDIVQEIRLITNQFAAEFGRAAGSVMNVITKSGTNAFRGTAFWFHNDNSLNTRSNLDKAAGLDRCAVSRGEPVGRHARRARSIRAGRSSSAPTSVGPTGGSGSGFTLNGAPTEAGRAGAAVGGGGAAAGAGPAEASAGRARRTADPRRSRSAGQTYTVPLGSLTGSASQGWTTTRRPGASTISSRQNHMLVGRYLLSDTSTDNTGTVQVTPPGLTANSPAEQPFAQRVAQQHLRRQHLERVPRGLVAPRHHHRSRQPDVAGDPVARDHRARHDAASTTRPTAPPSVWR